jgi:hypothetical protein
MEGMQMKLRLVGNASDALRWWSIRFAAFGFAVQGGWEALQMAGLTDNAPDWAQSVISAIIFFGVIAGRLLDQGGADDKP